MIIYEMRKPTELNGGEYAGVTGENLAQTLEFLIKGMTDADLSYYIHLRFSDGSVNSVIPDSSEVSDEGTYLVWQIKENDIFAHGYFELQIEGRTSDDDGLVFQTEIVTLYADESLAIEDNEYANPNSETLKLREEAQAALAEIKKSGISDKESLSNKVSDDDNLTSDSYPSVNYLKAYYYTADAVDEKLDDVSEQLSAATGDIEKLDTRLSETETKTAELETDLGETETKTSELETALSETNAALALKPAYESGSGTLQPASSTYEGNEGVYYYEKVGNIVVLTIKITKTDTSLKYFAMTGLPYPSGNDTKQSKIMAGTSNFLECCITLEKNRLTFKKTSGNFVDDETIVATIVYVA